jgi:hypothetical protein
LSSRDIALGATLGDKTHTEAGLDHAADRLKAIDAYPHLERQIELADRFHDERIEEAPLLGTDEIELRKLGEPDLLALGQGMSNGHDRDKLVGPVGENLKPARWQIAAENAYVRRILGDGANDLLTYAFLKIDTDRRVNGEEVRQVAREMLQDRRDAGVNANPAALDLIVTMDDATGAIYSAFLIEEEGTASTFRGLSEVFSQHGLPMSLYTDRGAHYFHTPKAGGEIDRGHRTQVGRALDQLAIEHIGAYSPQARGRSERAFQTLQDRLPKELRLAGIETIETANAFIREVYLPAHNARFAVEPAGQGSAFTPIAGVDLDEVLRVQEERQVGQHNCVSYRTLKLQIPESPMRPHFVRARVKVHVYSDGSHALFHGPRCIGRYENGAIRDSHDEKRAA